MGGCVFFLGLTSWQWHTLTYSSFGGKEAALQDKAKSEAKKIGADGKEMAEEAKEGAQGIADQAKAKAGEVKAKVVK